MDLWKLPSHAASETLSFIAAVGWAHIADLENIEQDQSVCVGICMKRVLSIRERLLVQINATLNSGTTHQQAFMD